MREILFRGKRLDNGEWVEGYFVKKIDPLFKTEICFILIQEYDKSCIDGTPTVLKSEMTWYRVIPETVGQYTGLTDNTKWEQLTKEEQSDWLKNHTKEEWNGKKIFEGDIVVCRKEICGNWIDMCVEIGYVEMKHGAFGLHRKRGYYRPFKDWLEDYEYEVISNIHDNPELLEDEG